MTTKETYIVDDLSAHDRVKIGCGLDNGGQVRLGHIVRLSRNFRHGVGIGERLELGLDIGVEFGLRLGRRHGVLDRGSLINDFSGDIDTSSGDEHRRSHDLGDRLHVCHGFEVCHRLEDRCGSSDSL